MKAKLPLIARILMGLVFAGGGIAFFLTPPPADMPENMKAFFAGLQSTHYFFYLLKGTEVVCGLMLLSGFFVPLALVVLAPIILNILLVHAFLVPQGLPLAIVLGVLETYLAFFSPKYSPVVKQLFKI